MLANIRDRAMGLSRTFILIVLAPTVLAIIYFGFIASDVYISESKFVVRSPDKPASSGLGIILKTAGFSNSSEESYAAETFVESRDALRILNRANLYQQAYERPYISMFDRFNPTGSGGSFEELYRFYGDHVHIDHDSTSSIATLKVRAFSGADAKRINEQLLEMAEATVNRLNVRGRQDLIRFARTEVDDAKRSASSAAIALSSFRDRSGIVDPEKQATVQTQMISKLQDELITATTELDQLRSMAPQNPQVQSLEVKRATLERAIREQLSLVAGGRRSLASQTAQYQRLFLESQIADKQLASAMGSLDEALNEARRKQSYIERIVEPSQPDNALEPRRLRGILGTFVLGLIAYGILSMLLSGIREHQD
ncbi:hypothetical protein AWL63_10865 [Sphingomonas panacis]|uniref:Capsule biosynthesis protein n=1 Tax=Sphingomonas panacis TaxID=1560345 RepID=A0A1B3ZAE6_9SPHN|nr:hypothetical protein [Sphingomonas panacis]AOH84392.1 hypothetical protein AWL63_10865 [Sphingomonas panacis]